MDVIERQCGAIDVQLEDIGPVIMASDAEMDPPGERSRHSPPQLSLREREVLRWIAQGKSTGQVGAILGISEQTVTKLVADASKKLGTVSLTHAVAIALRDCLIEV